MTVRKEKQTEWGKRLGERIDQKSLERERGKKGEGGLDEVVVVVVVVVVFLLLATAAPPPPLPPSPSFRTHLESPTSISPTGVPFVDNW